MLFSIISSFLIFFISADVNIQERNALVDIYKDCDGYLWQVLWILFFFLDLIVSDCQFWKINQFESRKRIGWKAIHVRICGMELLVIRKIRLCWAWIWIQFQLSTFCVANCRQALAIWATLRKFTYLLVWHRLIYTDVCLQRLQGCRNSDVFMSLILGWKDRFQLFSTNSHIYKDYFYEEMK